LASLVATRDGETEDLTEVSSLMVDRGDRAFVVSKWEEEVVEDDC
jgi:hypothetical protein